MTSRDLPPAIIPQPSKCELLSGRHSLLPVTRIITAPEFGGVAGYLQSALQRATGWAIEVKETSEAAEIAKDAFLKNAVCMFSDAEIGNPEGYRLRADWMAIRIRASKPAGAFHAVQTLLQLLPPAVHCGVPRADVEWSLPCVHIEDAPRFPWRGAMLDSCRHFQPVAFIKKFIDLLALHKMNVFHWHLTEDQGWRIEIKKYPRLAEIGSRRRESPLGHDLTKGGGDGIPHEGFYTQEEIREIVAYAAERFVTIVPEIEMPGHARAAIAAYPSLGCLDEPVEVATTWGIHSHIYNVEESTFEFLQDVLDEVMALFPGEFIHVGGDEAVKTQWETSAKVQARMKEIGVADVHKLQSYFISRMGKYLQARGRRLVGWDEILEGGLPTGATVMSWRGVEGGIAAANAGHDVVMAPHHSTYLDHCQSLDTSCEPLAIGGHLTLEKVYAYEPIPAEITAGNASHILGIQGQIWTEYIATTDHVEYMAYPRLCAIAEVAWSAPVGRDFGNFKSRLTAFLKRLTLLGVRYRPLD